MSGFGGEALGVTDSRRQVYFWGSILLLLLYRSRDTPGGSGEASVAFWSF